MATVPLAERLNDACQCIWVDRALLARQLRAGSGAAAPLPQGMVSGSVVFVGARQAAAMDRTIALITQVMRSAAWEQRVAGQAPAIARVTQSASDGMLGFDFHLGAPEPQLIEVNTNPGGLLVSLALARAATAHCDCLAEPLRQLSSASVPLTGVEERIMASFRAAFAAVRGGQPLRSIAIVDDAPEAQYLWPEFVLYQQLFARAGLHASIVDASQLAVQDDTLLAAGTAVELVYNRCTDFYLEEPAHAALRATCERGLAVVVPDPAAHARWADKRSLAWLRDAALLREAGLDAPGVARLRATIPHTEIVDAARADDLWARRRTLFFKPATGFGSRAAYRGDKITRKAFEHVLAHPYVAQALAPASTRRVPLAEGEEGELRVDVRNYVADGTNLLRTARLYQGQTTNFRTAGGGFAPVLTVPDVQMDAGLAQAAGGAAVS
jgi:hypothetical protein